MDIIGSYEPGVLGLTLMKQEQTSKEQIDEIIEIRKLKTGKFQIVFNFL